MYELSRVETVWSRSEKKPRKNLLTILLRIRNESLILKDTLEHLSQFSDAIVAYDDCSSDNTLDILKGHPNVSHIIQNTEWESTIQGRQIAETRHRSLLLQLASTELNPTWVMCCDADERYVGNIREFLEQDTQRSSVNAIKISLFDAYITEEDLLPYQNEIPLLNFRKSFGPERRDILMLWRPSESIYYAGLDSREPTIDPSSVQAATKFHCQHYGKSLSIKHWEDTCDYYVNYFPYEPYGKKWSSRKGRAVHSASDFGRPLHSWGKDLFENAVLEF